MYLKHRRTESDGYCSHSLCTRCVGQYNRRLVVFSNYERTDNSTCRVCMQQQHSLRSMASHRVFHMDYNLDKCELSHYKTYKQYMYTAKTRSQSVEQTVPEKFHKFTSDFGFLPGRRGVKLHAHCLSPGNPPHERCYGLDIRKFQ